MFGWWHKKGLLNFISDIVNIGVVSEIMLSETETDHPVCWDWEKTATPRSGTVTIPTPWLLKGMRLKSIQLSTFETTTKQRPCRLIWFFAHLNRYYARENDVYLQQQDILTCILSKTRIFWPLGSKWPPWPKIISFLPIIGLHKQP